MLLNLSRATTCSVGRLGLSPNTFACVRIRPSPGNQRSEEHTSELQSRSDLVCRLLLEKKKKKRNIQMTTEKNTSEIKTLANVRCRSLIQKRHVSGRCTDGVLKKRQKRERFRCTHLKS